MPGLCIGTSTAYYSPHPIIPVAGCGGVRAVKLLIHIVILMFAALVVLGAFLFAVIDMFTRVDYLKEKAPWLKRMLERRSAFGVLLLVTAFLLIGDGYELLTKEIPEANPPTVTFPAPSGPVTTPKSTHAALSPSQAPSTTGQAPSNTTQSLQAHLSVSQSLLISTRSDAPFATKVVIQTDKEFPSLRFVMQCDKPLVDTEYALGGTSGMAQQMVSSGLAPGRPNTVLYSYGSSTPPFGPANPLIIELWSKEAVTCNQVATF